MTVSPPVRKAVEAAYVCATGKTALREAGQRALVTSRLGDAHDAVIAIIEYVPIAECRVRRSFCRLPFSNRISRYDAQPSPDATARQMYVPTDPASF